MHQEILSVQSSVYNQEMSIHWSSNQMPRLLHSKFKLDPLKKSPVESSFCGPHISAHAFPTRMASLIFIWKIDFYLIKKIDLESPLIFVLFLKGKQNKKEKP